MADPETSRHSNNERTVYCPVEECGEERLARGIHLHVRQTSGGGHGESGEVPPHISLDELETAGEKEVEMEYPTVRDADSTARLCPYCWQSFRGSQGVQIHLGQVSGRHGHPADANETHEPEDFPVVTVDANENVVQAIGVAESSATDSEGEVSEKRCVYRYIAWLLAENKFEEAIEARRVLTPVE